MARRFYKRGRFGKQSAPSYASRPVPVPVAAAVPSPEPMPEPEPLPEVTSEPVMAVVSEIVEEVEEIEEIEVDDIVEIVEEVEEEVEEEVASPSHSDEDLEEMAWEELRVLGVSMGVKARSRGKMISKIKEVLKSDGQTD